MKTIKEVAKLIEFDSIGSGDVGFISVAEYSGKLPFHLKRCYWTYFTPHHITRGGHSHHILEQVLIAVAGNISIFTETANGKKNEYILDDPNIGLYLPPHLWHTMKFSHNAVLLCLASEEYDESDYIRDYKTFKKSFGHGQ